MTINHTENGKNNPMGSGATKHDETVKKVAETITIEFEKHGRVFDEGQDICLAKAALVALGASDWTMSNPEVRASSERISSLAKQNVSIDCFPAFPELEHIGSDIKTMFLAFEAEIQEQCGHINACADENEHLRAILGHANRNIERLSAENDHLRKLIVDYTNCHDGNPVHITSETLEGVKTGLVVNEPQSAEIERLRAVIHKFLTDHVDGCDFDDTDYGRGVEGSGIVDEMREALKGGA